MNAEVYSNDPDKEDDGKVSIESSIGFDVLGLFGFGAADQKKIHKSGGSYVSSERNTVTKGTFFGIEDETKEDVLGNQTQSISHTIFAIKLGIGFEFKAPL